MASKLHEGSRWEDDSVIERDGTIVDFCDPDDMPPFISLGTSEDDFHGAYPEDLLAVIRRWRRDPLAIAAASLARDLRELEAKGHITIGGYTSVYLKELEELLP